MAIQRFNAGKAEKHYSMSYMVCVSFDNPVCPKGRGECICPDIVREEPEGKKSQATASDTEYTLKDGH